MTSGDNNKLRDACIEIKFLFIGTWAIKMTPHYSPIPKDGSRLFFETITRLLAVPNGPWQRKLATDPVLANGAQRPTAQFFSLDVVRFQPKRLQFGMIVWGKLMALQYPIQFFEIAAVEGDNCFRFEDTFVFMEFITGGQRPQETAEPFNIARLLQHFAHTRDLLLSESEARQQRTHARWRGRLWLKVMMVRGAQHGVTTAPPTPRHCVAPRWITSGHLLKRDRDRI